MYRCIVAMSVDRQKVRDDLIDSGKQVALHLVKLALYPYAQERNHWKQEIYAFLHDVPKLKGTNKLPKEKFIFDAISAWNDTADNLILEAIDEEESLQPANVTVNEIEYLLNEYHKWAAQELAANGILRRNDVYNKIDELI